MSRFIIFLLMLILIGIVGFMILERKSEATNSDDSKGKVELVSIEKAMKTKRPLNLRTSANVNVESCNKAEKQVKQLVKENAFKASDKVAIENKLLEVMALVTNDSSVETHLSCLIHRLPVRG